jgi:hypothetical protein
VARPGDPGFGSKAPVAVDVEPRDAEVRFVAENRSIVRAKGRDTIYLLPGRYEVEISKRGYRTHRETLVVRGTERHRVAYDLRRGETTSEGDGRVRLDIRPRDAEIYFDGRLRSRDGDAVIRLPARTYDVEVRRPGYRTWRTNITVRRNQTTRLEYDLRRGDDNRGEARVRLDIRPRDAQVRFNGVVKSNDGEGTVRVRAGVYDVEVRRRGYRTWRTRLNLRAGEVHRLERTLEKE